MASNPYINKVEYGGTTLIDLTNDTAVASDVASGKYFHLATGERVQGTMSGGGAISVVDTTDAAGGIIRTITAVDISDTTAVASDVASGKYFYTANGTKTQGTASGGITPTGNINITAAGQTDVTNYATATVAAGTEGTPTATKGTVSSHSIAVTPSVTNTAGYISGGTHTGTAVTVSASELVSGSETKTQNGTYDVTNLAELVVNVSGGGGGDSWSWMGKNPTKVKTYVDEKVYLKDSGFASWTPTTTDTSLVAAANYERYYGSADYDYVIYYRWHTHYEYSSQPNYSINDYYHVGAYFIYGVWSDKSHATSGTPDSYASQTASARSMMIYKASTGVDTYASQTNYGVYPAISAPGTGNLNLTAKSYQIKARCSASYFSTTAAAAVDQDASFYEQTVELWQVDRGTTPTGFFMDDTRDMWLNGF